MRCPTRQRKNFACLFWNAGSGRRKRADFVTWPSYYKKHRRFFNTFCGKVLMFLLEIRQFVSLKQFVSLNQVKKEKLLARRCFFLVRESYWGLGFAKALWFHFRVSG